MTKIFRNPVFMLALALVAVALAVAFTPAVTLDNLGDGLLQIIPASVVGVLLFFGFITAFKRLNLMDDDSQPEDEAESAFDRVKSDPVATAIYIAGAFIAIGIIIGGGLS